MAELLDNWGTGGSLNPSARRPSWQVGPGVDNPYSNGKRQEPDVSAPGDPESGWLIVVTRGTAAGRHVSSILRKWTSPSPMAEPAGLTGVAYLNPTLYAVALRTCRISLFHDVVRGNNLLTKPPLTRHWLLARLTCPGLGDAIIAAWSVVCRLLSGAPDPPNTLNSELLRHWACFRSQPRASTCRRRMR